MKENVIFYLLAGFIGFAVYQSFTARAAVAGSEFVGPLAYLPPDFVGPPGPGYSLL